MNMTNGFNHFDEIDCTGVVSLPKKIKKYYSKNIFKKRSTINSKDPKSKSEKESVIESLNNSLKKG